MSAEVVRLPGKRSRSRFRSTKSRALTAEILDEIWRMLSIEEPWAVRTPDKITWWAHRTAQRITVSDARPVAELCIECKAEEENLERRTG